MYNHVQSRFCGQPIFQTYPNIPNDQHFGRSNVVKNCQLRTQSSPRPASQVWVDSADWEPGGHVVGKLCFFMGFAEQPMENPLFLIIFDDLWPTMQCKKHLVKPREDYL